MEKIPRIIIVGAGFGGLRAAKALVDEPVRVLLIDRVNYHLFQPLLYQVATAGLEAEQVARPVRAIFRRDANLEFRMTEVEHLLLSESKLQTSHGRLGYDFLILAIGAQTDTFGIEGITKSAFPLKTLADSIAIRNRILEIFEQATFEEDPDKRKSMLTFAIVGGGPTGVEMAGALSELISLVLVKDFPKLDFDEVRIILMEGQARILPGFPPDLRVAAEDTLRSKGVDVWTETLVEDYDGQLIRCRDSRAIPAGMVIWSAGVRAAEMGFSEPVHRGAGGRYVVTPELHLPGYENVYIIGDAAYIEDQGEPLPMMAPVAIQMAETAAKNILRHLQGRSLEAFRYKDPGSLATIGRNQAVAKIGRLEFTGWVAWLVWLVVHLIQIIGFRNRIMVLINWAWDYFFYDRGVRIIHRS